MILASLLLLSLPLSLASLAPLSAQASTMNFSGLADSGALAGSAWALWPGMADHHAAGQVST